MCQASQLAVLFVKKVDTIAFIATVINYTAQVSKKLKKLDIIVAAAYKYLGLQEFTAEDLQRVLAMEDVPPYQAPVPE